MPETSRRVVVIGAGPAGLATSYHLKRRGIDHVVLERGDRPGHTFATIYDSLVLHTARGMSALPGRRFKRGTPLFVDRQRFVDYLARYAEEFQLPVRLRHTVTRVTRNDGDDSTWAISTDQGTFTAAALVVATGIASNPHVPPIPGRSGFSGRVIHSREYLRPDGFAGRRVLVIGVGNSGGEIASELASAGASVTIGVRSGARVVPRDLLGIPIQYLALAMSGLPRTVQQRVLKGMNKVSTLLRGPSGLPAPPDKGCSGVPLIGFHLVDEIRSGRIALKGGLRELTGHGAVFQDGSQAAFDDVILATGYRATLDFLDGLVTRDDCGFARRRDRVVSIEQPNLYFVGHTYDIKGAIYNIARDARRVADLIQLAGQE